MISGALSGFDVRVEPRRPRYELPLDVPPPPGMSRAEFAAWSISVCGYQPPVLMDGEVLRAGCLLYMNHDTWERIKVDLSQLAKGVA